MKIYLYAAGVLVLLAIGAGLWFSGDSHGKGVSDAKCNAERLAVATATNSELARLKKQTENYAAQINEANVARIASDARLAALAAQPHPHILCHAAPKSGSGPVPGVPAAAGGGAAGTGALPPDNGFDPGKRLYPEVADSCDALVESYRHTLALWPH